LRVEILRDICARLTQKIVVSILKVNSQSKRTLRELFNEYYRKAHSMLMNRAFKALKDQRDRNLEMKRLSIYAIHHMQTFTKARVLIALKNINQYKEAERVKQAEASSIILARRLNRVFTNWKISVIEGRVKEINRHRIAKYAEFKYKHRLFVEWSHRVRT